MDEKQTCGGAHVVVTGGAGFIGSHLCTAWLRAGARVTAMDDLSTGEAGNVAHLAENPSFELVVADVSVAIPDVGAVDLLYHLASPAAPRHYLSRPVQCLRAGSFGTFHALEAAKRSGARFVLASTSEIYGDPLVHPQEETYWGNVNPIGPRSVYDEAKRFAEAVTAQYARDGLDAAIVRIFNTFGPRMQIDDGRVVPAFLSQALRDETLTIAGDGSQTRSLCYVDDLVDGLVRMGRASHPGPINLGGSEELTVLDLAHRIIALLGSSSSVTFIPRPVDDPYVRRPDTTRARSVLGWHATWPLDEALLLTARDLGQRVRPQWSGPTRQLGATAQQQVVTSG